MIDNIVLNIPHSSSEFPGTAKDGWENGIDEHIQRWTDWGTDRLFGMASSMDPRIHPVTFPWSRFFCDVERLENDPLEKIG
ncbi:MAG: N-formylglutamate amidohydrolase, partial [Lachnospiraceae bacterium]|nr:N-formylglutamate amidohydrolase [Lachnospiraceae bacterium]